jgi:hypothetical protein
MRWPWQAPATYEPASYAPEPSLFTPEQQTRIEAVKRARTALEPDYGSSVPDAEAVIRLATYMLDNNYQEAQ